MERMSTRLLELPVPRPPGIVMVAYGGGVNTVALLVKLKRMRVIPRAIVMADPGSERRATIFYRDEVLPAWLDANGFPRVTVISRAEEGKLRERSWRHETLLEECLRISALPSVAYGWKKCSQKYKGEASRWWIARQSWALDEWASGRKIVKAIGYDAGESGRVRHAFQNAWENDRMVPWYPLHYAGIDRDQCEELILSEGLPLPGKSSCTYCPNNTLDEWKSLRDEEPDRFAEAVELSRCAIVEVPDVVGLMRCNPHGKRQLHVWAAGGYGQEVRVGGCEDELPCECAL
jgi:hypothetical protein